MIGVRTALWISGFLGVLYALIGAFSSLQDVGAGMVVAAVSILAWGLLDWMEEH